jgi:hypothetical protein
MEDAALKVKKRRQNLIWGLVAILIVSGCELARDYMCYRVSSIALKAVKASHFCSTEEDLENIESTRESIRWNMGMHAGLILITVGCLFEARAISRQYDSLCLAS